MAKFRVKLALKDRDVPNKVEFGRIVFANMTGNPDFTAPSPTLAELKTVTDDLELAYDNSKHGLLSTATLNTAEENFDTIMSAMGNYVGSIAKGTRAIINGAGMDAVEASHIPIPLTKVLGVEGKTGKLTGDVFFDWEKVKGCRVYVGYLIAADAPPATKPLEVFTTKSKITIGGLEPGKKYLLVLKAIGAAGVGPESDQASAYAAF